MSLDEEPHCPTSLRSRSKRLGSVPSRVLDLSTSIVPEDLEYQHPQQPQIIGGGSLTSEVMESSLLFRKRSSSLPRILPPILDRDQDNEEDDALGTWPISSLQIVNKQLTFKNVNNQLSFFKNVNNQLLPFKNVNNQLSLFKNVNKQLSFFSKM